MHMIMHRIHMTQDEMVEWHLRLNGHDLSILWELVMDREV